jgi:hypothetical protein
LNVLLCAHDAHCACGLSASTCTGENSRDRRIFSGASGVSCHEGKADHQAAAGPPKKAQCASHEEVEGVQGALGSDTLPLLPALVASALAFCHTLKATILLLVSGPPFGFPSLTFASGSPVWCVPQRGLSVQGRLAMVQRSGQTCCYIAVCLVGCVD